VVCDEGGMRGYTEETTFSFAYISLLVRLARLHLEGARGDT
jgi:hypothetical protein